MLTSPFPCRNETRVTDAINNAQLPPSSLALLTGLPDKFGKGWSVFCLPSRCGGEISPAVT